MSKQLRPALATLALFTVLTGLVYPAVVTGLADLLFPRQAEGSLVRRNGAVVGSALIGQPFADPRYFWGRLSATQPVPYNGAASTGSNRGQGHPDLLRASSARVRQLRTADPYNARPVPVDLATASGSGLDPHISPASAEFQVPRVARARGLAEGEIRRLVVSCTEGRQLGIWGEARVNVLLLNLALDELR